MIFKDLAIKQQDNYDYPIILAKQGNKIHELSDEVLSTDNIEFLTINDKLGFDAYCKSIKFLMIKSFYKVIGKDNIDYLRVLFSLGDSLYIESAGNFILDEELLDTVKNKMFEIVKSDIQITKKTINKDEALNLFHEYKMYDKEKLFKYRRVSKISLYSLGHFDDYFYGDLAYSTGILGYFDLKLYKDGFLLMLPNIKNPLQVADFCNMDNLYNALKNASIWSNKIGINTVADLNNAIVERNIDDIILIQESKMEHEIGDLAEKIASDKNIKFVMIAGPSSSGKTSFSHRLSIQLKTLGLNPHPISVDDYFKNRDTILPGPDGKVDLESIDIVDTKQFNEDMVNLLNGDTVELPVFNFVTGKREYRGNYLTLNDNDILVIEGIHCLNDKMSYALSNDNKFRIYISALSQLRIDEHNRVPSSDLRMIRRMCRDARTRGTSAIKTIDIWESVRAGETKNIFPYQENADIIFNSSLIYELLILKEIAEPLLFGVDIESEEYIEAKRLLKFLDFFLSYNDKTVCVNSLLKEFIGGSYFNV